MLMVQDVPAPVVIFPNPGPPEEVFIIVALLAAITGAVLILRPLAKAWALRLSRPSGQVEELEQRIADLEAAESGDLNALQGELSDLHERLDFTERLLSQAQIPKAMPQEPTDETTGVRHAP